MGFVRFKYFWRPVNLKLTPATVTMNNRPIRGKGAAFHLTPRWIGFIHGINSDRGARYVLGKQSGWVNNWDADNTPISESVTMGGNIAQVLGEVPGFFLLDSLQPADPAPYPDDRLHVHLFTCVDILSHPRPPADGTLMAYYPFITNGPAWVEAKNVEWFPFLPEPVFPSFDLPVPVQDGGYAAIVLHGAVIRQSPSGVKIFKTDVDFKASVTSELRGFAKIGDKRWVDLDHIRKL